MFAPISYAVRGGELASELHRYKRAPAAVMAEFEKRFAAILWRFLVGHESCVRRAAGVTDLPVVVAVPSTKPAASEPRPLSTILAMIPSTRDRLADVLAVNGEVPQDRTVVRADRFVARADLRDNDVLLVDDTWVTGCHAQSAAAALKAAGAGAVALVTIGRWVVPAPRSPQAALVATARQTPFDWSQCAVHP